MKKYIYFIVFLFISEISFGQATTNIPQYTLEVKNFSFVDANTLVFDLVFTHTDAIPLELAGWQFFYRIPVGFGTLGFLTGANSSFVYDSSGGNAVSDLPVAFRPRSPSVANSGGTHYELRTAANTLPGAGNGLVIPQGVPTLIGRYKIKSTTPININSTFIIRDSCETPLSVTRSKLNWYNENSFNQEFTRCASHSVYLNFGNQPPVPNFTSDRQTIFSGEGVNFTDASYNNPNSWLWTFPGGTPSSSNLKNPPLIVYNTPGIYNVTLQVSSPFGTNSITASNYITVNSTINCPFTWQSSIKATDAGNVRDSLRFGMSPQATDLIDTCLGESVIPPAPPAGIFDYRFVLSNNDGVKTDFRTDTALSKTWKMNFQPSASGYPFTFTWNNSLFPADGSFYLKDITGVIVNVNMRNQNSYTLTNSAIGSLNIIYTYNTTKNISVLSGWNIISVPLNVPDMSVGGIFPGAASPAYSYNNGYINSATLSNGKGYWLKFNSAGNYSVTGLPVNPEHINISGLWNLIGPFDKNIPVSNIISVPSGLISSYFFGFNDGYIISDTLKAGRGYWIRSNGSGYLKNGSADNIALKENTSYENMITFNFSDATGKSAQLYLSKGSGNIQNADLPPVPPAGIFDVRFSTDKFIESSDQNQIVKLNSSGESFKLKVTNLNGGKFRIKDNLNGSLLNKELIENEEIIINSALDNFTIINESLLPDSYELSQNFPNPFNPSTTIKYQIPKEGNVKIIIYSVLGKEILTLVNDIQQAGKYEINFNAVDLSSGIYFYRLETGEFSDLKRMILIK